MAINLLDELCKSEDKGDGCCRCQGHGDYDGDKEKEERRVASVKEWVNFLGMYLCDAGGKKVEHKFALAYPDHFKDSIGVGINSFKFVYEEFLGRPVTQVLYNVDGKGLTIFLIEREYKSDMRGHCSGYGRD